MGVFKTKVPAKDRDDVAPEPEAEPSVTGKLTTGEYAIIVPLPNGDAEVVSPERLKGVVVTSVGANTWARVYR